MTSPWKESKGKLYGIIVRDYSSLRDVAAQPEGAIAGDGATSGGDTPQPAAAAAAAAAAAWAERMAPRHA
eukprot:gene7176-biopygen3256